ncbi:MAG TPA: TolC family protein [Verrucomicrobiota bacterium]|nr:TolC family protein [Verrucomicrobiota bacterium]HNT14366.1 TolC family protein [Verrucomicrobiota bacterium]
MKNKILGQLVAGLLMGSAWSGTGWGQPPPELSGTGASSADAAELQLTPALLERWVAELATNHPALRAARARTRAAAAQIESIRTWADPVARVGGMAADRMMRQEDGDFQYGLEQQLPLFGKPEAQRQLAAAERAVAATAGDAQFQVLRSELLQALCRAARVDETVAIAEQDLHWLELTTRTVEAGYQSGNGRLVDVLTLQNEQSKRIAGLQTERENRAQAYRAVNRLLNRDLTSAWPRLRLPPVADAIPFEPRLFDAAAARSPDLAVVRAEMQVAEAGVQLARKERWPDVMLEFQNSTYVRERDWRSTEVMLGFSIPWGNRARYRAAIRREEEKRRAAELEALNVSQAVQVELHALLTRVAGARREALLYRDQVIPRSEQALAGAKALFESGGGLRDVLDARRMWLDGRLRYTGAVAEQYQALAELARYCGVADWEALQALTHETKGNTP